jgi:glycosyltransferase involved in cell wall biosynthesis
MPAFNVERYIGEAIKSVLNQSVTDWELIIVDDGSTDHTVDKVQELKDSRFRLFQQNNRGAPAARNRGLSESRGDLIIFLDADDRLRPPALERLLQALHASPKACVAYGEGVVMDEDGHVFGPERGPIFSHRPSGDILRTILQRNPILTMGAAITRASSLVKSGGFREDLRIAEDWELWCRLSAIGEFVYIGAKPIIEYRLHSKSLVRTLGMSIDESLRSTEAVYSNPEITKRFTERKLVQLRKKREASAFSLAGTQCIKIHNWTEARHFFFESIRRNPLTPREIILLAVAIMQWMPYSLERRLK